MSKLVGSIRRLYAWSIALYPPGFREAFGEELRWVFELAVREKAGEGWGPLALFCLREAVGWGTTIGQQHLEAMFRRSSTSAAPGGFARPDVEERRRMRRPEMAEARQHSDASPDAAKSKDIIAALPPLMFGLGIAATSLVRGGPWYSVPSWRLYLSLIVGLIPTFVIGVGAVLALVRRLPDWGWTWLGSALIGAALLVQSLAGEAEQVGRALPGWAETVITLVFFAIGGVLLVASALRGWRHAGLFSMAAAGTFGLSMYLAIIAGPFFRHDLAPLAAPLGLVYAGLVYAFLRTNGRTSALPIIAIGVLNLASFSLANTVWRAWLIERSRSSPLIPLVVLGTALLASGPAAGLFLRPVRSLAGRPS